MCRVSSRPRCSAKVASALRDLLSMPIFFSAPSGFRGRLAMEEAVDSADEGGLGDTTELEPSDRLSVDKDRSEKQLAASDASSSPLDRLGDVMAETPVFRNDSNSSMHSSRVPLPSK